MTSKYVVFKIDEFNKFIETCNDEGFSDNFIPNEIEDAEVIRHQDITAGPIFAAYAHMLTSYHDLLNINEHQSGILLSIADHFHEASRLAEECPHKRLPD